VAEMRRMNVTPHIAQNEKRPGGSAVDARTTRHAGYRVSMRKRKRIEEVFGWLKTVALLRKTKHRGVFLRIPGHVNVEDSFGSLAGEKAGQGDDGDRASTFERIY
jgi:hypothetical protein